MARTKKDFAAMGASDYLGVNKDSNHYAKERLAFYSTSTSWQAKAYMEAYEDVHYQYRQLLSSYDADKSLREAYWVVTGITLAKPIDVSALQKEIRERNPKLSDHAVNVIANARAKPVTEALEAPALARMVNPVSAYIEAGEKAAMARNRRDESLANHWTQWALKAYWLESEGINRTTARDAFDTAYRAARTI